VEIPIRRIADRPFAGARVQGEGGYEVSVGSLECRQLLIAQHSRTSWESNALSIHALGGLFVKKLGHAFLLCEFHPGLRRTLQRSAAGFGSSWRSYGRRVGYHPQGGTMRRAFAIGAVK